MIREMHDMLARARRRLSSIRLWRGLSLWWLMIAAVAWGVWLSGGMAGESAWRLSVVLVVIGLAGSIVAHLWWGIESSNPFWTARQIERRHPELGALLLAALEQAPTPRFRRLGYLQTEAIKNAVAHGRRHNWAADVPLGQLWLTRLASVAALALMVGACGLLLRTEAATISAIEETAGPDTPAIPEGTRNFDVVVEPGHTEVERGTTLLVVAKFGRTVPNEAQLAVRMAQPTAGEPSDSLRPMTRSLDDPQFVGRVDRVMGDLAYQVEYAGRKTDSYRITVFDYPALERADADLVFPSFTSLEPKHIDDVRTLTAVEGTELTFTFRLNKRVVQGQLVNQQGESISLQELRDADSPMLTTTLRLAESQRFKLHLVDEQGRKNKIVPELVVKVTPNNPPSLKLKAPGSDVRVSPIEELDVVADVADDYGLVRYGIAYAMGGAEPRELALFDKSGDGELKKQAELTHLIAMEEMQAEPDQLLSYYVWAEDVATDGSPRKVMSDMFFAEVRHFEEIFREGEQLTSEQQRQQQQQQEQQGQPGGAAQQAEELAELQKQIVSATWKLIRRETSEELFPEFSADVEVIAESQQQALDLLEAMAEELTDAESQEFAVAAGEEMRQARTTLESAARSTDRGLLRTALSHEQAAYQALLKLRAREFDVSRQNQPQQSGQQGGSQSSANRSQQQLQQLELSSEENRYETQSRASEAAQQAAEAATQQAREALNRLRELARRQEDLNERVRELQAALEAAEDEAKQEELERQLKRLREQQQEMLRDTEELQSELETSENSRLSPETSQQLEETRERVQRASEALQQGELNEALTEGTRAERGLNDLREEFRQQTADRFSEELRDLREAARQLDERQQQLSEQLANENRGQNRSLRDRGEREALREGLEQQREQLGELLNQIEQTVSAAEEPEPLLARELYEAAQGVNEQQVDQALELVEQMLEVGVTQEAGQPMEAADRGIGQLRAGIDRAAESVLGDETESLRRAERTLQDLAQQLNEEIRRGRGEAEPVAEPRPGQPQREGQPGQPGQGGQTAEQQPGGEESQSQQSSETGQLGEAQADTPPREGPQQGDRGQQQGEAGQQQGEQSPAPESSTGSQPVQQSGGQQPGEPQATDQPPSGAQPGQPQDESNEENPFAGPPQPGSEQRPQGGSLRGGATAGNRDSSQWGGLGLEDLFREIDQPDGPITGESYREWDDRMRDVEQLLDDPELRGEASRIRDRVEAERREFKRHAKEPDWTKLQDLVAEPLIELQQRIGEEIRRRESPDSLVPIDRDPVPVEFTEKVRRYYERLGSGE